MAERLGTPIRGLWTYLISTLGWLISLPKRLLQRIWSGLSGVGFWLANKLATAGRVVRLLWNRVLQRPLHFVFLSLSAFAGWFFVDVFWDGL
jgi:hypothetical protein